MSEQDAGRKAHRKFAVSSAIETGISQINDPKQGARLVRAFLRIANPAVRLAIVQMVEKVGVCSRGIVIVIVCRNVRKLVRGGGHG